MGWIFGALIVVAGLTMIIAGTSGTAGQAWEIITGHGSSSSSASTPGLGIGGNIGPGLGAMGAAYNYPHVGAA